MSGNRRRGGTRLALSKGERVIAALDVGSSKVAALIALLTPGNEPRILGFGHQLCTGVRKGMVADMEATERAIRAAMDQAEKMAETTVDRVIVSMSSGGLSYQIHQVDVDIAGHQIERADIDRVLMEGRERIDPGGRTILHAIPAIYTIDGLTGVVNPLGFHAERLGVDILVVSADTAPLRNLDLCVRQAHLDVQAIVASPLASGLACLEAEQRELGVALVEMGAGVTNVSVLARGMVVGMACVPMGGSDIVDDIAAAFNTRRSHAERMLSLHGTLITTSRDNHDLIEVLPIRDGGPPSWVTKAQLSSVIRTRVEAILSETALRLDELGFRRAVGRSVVLTGGVADLNGIAHFATGVFGRETKIATPRPLEGLPEAATGPAFSTLVGLVLHELRQGQDIWRDARVSMNRISRSPLERMIEILRGSL